MTREEAKENEEAGRSQEPPVPLWPVWRFDSGYSELARYVTPAAIMAEPGLKAQLTPEESRLDEENRDLILAERLYERLRELGLRYDDSTWAAREGTQQVRHPWWLVSGRFGNCVDLSLTYAGMCLAANVGALLAFSRRHAFVVLTPGRLHLQAAAEEPFELDGFRPVEAPADPGVLSGSGADLGGAIEAGTVEAVDLVEVADGSDWGTAVAAARQRLGATDAVHLLDVAHLQIARGFAELPHPVAYRPSIRLRVPGGGEFRDFGAHAGAIAALREKDGMHVLIGERGRGKSTIPGISPKTPRTGPPGSSMPPTAKRSRTAWRWRCSRRRPGPSGRSSIPLNANPCGKPPPPTCASRRARG